MDSQSDISESRTIKKSGFEVAEGLKYRFDVEAKRRRLKSRDALAQALELWLATPPEELTRTSEMPSTEIATEYIQYLRPLQEQIKNIEVLAVAILKKVEIRRGSTRTNRESRENEATLKRKTAAIIARVENSDRGESATGNSGKAVG